MKKTLIMTMMFFQSFSSHAFEAKVHVDITSKALTKMGFDGDSINIVNKANLNVDKDEWTDPAAHFDSEKFEAGSKRLQMLLDHTVLSVRTGQKNDALIYIGRAFHAIQDFFSHSNFVELFSEKALIDFLRLKNPASDIICQAPSYFTGLTSGYFPDDTKPQNKCSHAELNKDASSNRSLHLKARRKAQIECEKWIQLINNTI